MYNHVVKNIIKRRSIEKYRRSIKKKVRSAKKKSSVNKKVRSPKKKVRSTKKRVCSMKKRVSSMKKKVSSMKKRVSSIKKVISKKKRTVKKRSVKKVTFKTPIDSEGNDYDDECNKITAKLGYLKISDKCSSKNIINFENLNTLFGADKIDKCYRKPTFKIDCSKFKSS
jgi:predicted RNase H-like nuclease (RuvC/YqgF family)